MQKSSSELNLIIQTAKEAATAAGLHCSRINGSALTYNHENPYLPDLLICRAELAQEILRLVADMG